MKRFTALVLLTVLTFMVGCAQKSEKLNIPDEYKSGISVNYFANTWSETEDGSDLMGDILFNQGDVEFDEISKYLADLKLSQIDNSGNFTSDFRFISNDNTKNGYDFVFFEDNKLILRDPDGNCFQVDIAESKYFDLKEYIGEIRLQYTSPPMVGAYSADRALDEEDKAIFEEAITGVADGTTYEPTLVATQIVAGTNYRFTTVATPDEPDATPFTAYVYIFKPLGDSAPELVDISNEML